MNNQSLIDILNTIKFALQNNNRDMVIANLESADSIIKNSSAQEKQILERINDWLEGTCSTDVTIFHIDKYIQKKEEYGQN